MRFDHHGVGLRPIPSPMDFVRRDAMEIPFLAEIAFVLDEKPDLAFHDVIDLL
jgi:hypothetical protein